MAMTAVRFPGIKIHWYKFQSKLRPLGQICNFLKSCVSMRSQGANALIHKTGSPVFKPAHSHFLFKKPSSFIFAITASAISFTALFTLLGFTVLVVPVQSNLFGLTEYMVVSIK